MTNACCMYEISIMRLIGTLLSYIAAELPGGSGCHEDSDGYDTDEEIRR